MLLKENNIPGCFKEITEEEALRLWETEPIFAFDTSQRIEWQINVEDNSQSNIKDQINNDCVLVVETF